MLIDAFTYWNESEMLAFRLRVLEPVVDRFIAVVADRTFAGKLCLFDLPRLKEFWEAVPRGMRDRVEFYRADVTAPATQAPPPVSYDPSHPCWSIERQQRGAITEALSRFSEEDFVLMGDVDEIPSRETVLMLKEKRFFGIATLRQFFFYYNLKTLRNGIWQGTVWCPVAALRRFGAQDMREARGSTGFGVDRAGWHLSYFGGARAIRAKLENFSHQEYNLPEFTDEDRIAGRVAKGADLFDRDITSGHPPDEFFPGYFRDAVACKEWWG